jgi:orotate phosphoribosyltransferase
MIDVRLSSGDVLGNGEAALERAREELLLELRTHALVIEDVVLTSGRTSSYLIDAKRAILRPAGFAALSTLVAAQAAAWGATAVGGMTMGADPIACAALAGGARVKAFFVRKEAKQHGLARRIEGPDLASGDRCLIVEDVVTTGGSTIRALEAVREAGHEICGVLAICDRLAGGAVAIESAAGAPFTALSTIDEIYPERPDR